MLTCQKRSEGSTSGHRPVYLAGILFIFDVRFLSLLDIENWISNITVLTMLTIPDSNNSLCSTEGTLLLDMKILRETAN